MGSRGVLKGLKLRRRPGVIFLLASVTVIPLLGIAWLTGGDVTDARRESQQTLAISDAAKELDLSVQLRSVLDSEAYWSQSIAAVATFGLPTDQVLAITGLDIERGLADARVAVDEVLARPGVPPEAAIRMQEVRDGISPGVPLQNINVGFDEVIELASQNLEQDIDNLIEASDQVGNSARLSTSIRALDLAAESQSELTELVERYFAVRFPVAGDASVEAERMLTAELRYQATIEQLRAHAQPGSPVDIALTNLENDPDQAWMIGRVHESKNVILAEGTSSPTFDQSLDFARAAEEVQTFRSAQQVIETHAALVRTASDVVVEAAAISSEEAALRQRQTATFTIGLVAAALAAVVLGSIWIVSPLRGMAAAVGQLRDGNPSSSVPEAGPAEVRQAAQALNEAIENMSVVEGMATALANRDLSNPAFSQPPTGRLGASLCEAVTELAASMSEGEAFRAQLAHEATHDGLTGLHNRSETMTQMNRALRKAIASGTPLAVLFIDVDGFKNMNDAHGHAIGDEILRSVARRIQRCIRGNDRVGRLGGDEFVVVAGSIDGVESAMALGERIRAAISKPISQGEVNFSVTTSIGVAVASKDSTGPVLLREADLALYEAKAQGRNRVQFCDDELKNRQSEQTSVEQRLALAITSDDLRLHFQPIIDADSMRIRSVEALLRWPTADGRFESPGEFIPIAERSDLILRIDKWVLEAVCKQISTWETQPELSELSVSVNLSARSVSRPDLAERVLGALHEHKVSAERLTIEVTETALLDDVQTAAASLKELRAAGVKVAIDDFGTGFASLAQLRRLPLDVLKIDQGFVANIDRPDDRSLIQLTIDTGHLLGASIVAEGVESTDQHDTLVSLGIDMAQGYLFGRPMPAEDLSVWTAANREEAAQLA